MSAPASPVVLAFDQAFQLTGWAAGTVAGPLACGRLDLRPRRFDSLGGRFLRFEKSVRELVQTHRPALIVFEEHRAHAGIQAAQVLGAVTALVMKCADEAGIDYAAVPVATLKKHATGTPRASKALMVAAARKKFPSMNIPDDNVADALHLLRWGVELLSTVQK